MNTVFFKMINSPAKINLFLHVIGKNSKNFHLLESLVVFIPELYDKIKIKKSQINEVVFTGCWGDRVGSENTVTKALKLIDLYVPDKFQISIEKNIPVGAGLGGGSSNAGCIIKYLLDKYKIKISRKKLLEICNSIGADVAMFLSPKALYFGGTGDIITKLKKIPTASVLIAYPGKELSTEKVYKIGFKKYTKSIQHKTSFESTNQLIKFLKPTKNDLYPNALKIFPELKILIASVEKYEGCLLARMTGSGASCFGIFDSIKNAKLGLKTLQNKFPDYSIYIGKVK